VDTKSGKLVERRLEHENGKVGGRAFDVGLNFSVARPSRRLQVPVAFQSLHFFPSLTRKARLLTI
jgi:hypothetical protein